MNNQSLPVMLREVVALVERATPGEWRHVRENGSPTTGMNMIAGSVPGYIANVRDTGTGRVVSDTRLIVADVNLLKQHGSALVGVVDGWRGIESAPRTGIAVLLWQPWKSGRDCTTIGHYANGWCDRFNEEMTPEPTHWRPLPAPPTLDSAMQQGGGGE